MALQPEVNLPFSMDTRISSAAALHAQRFPAFLLDPAQYPLQYPLHCWHIVVVATLQLRPPACCMLHVACAFYY